MGKQTGWRHYDGKPVNRIPDITVSYNNKPVVYLDAKCINYSRDESDQKGQPKANEINQMIVYLEHGEQC